MGVPVSFAFTEPCLLIQTYSVTVTAQSTGLEVVSPAFVSFDQPGHLLNVNTVNLADVGFYDMSVSSSLNLLDPNALTASTDTIDFELVISDSPCLKTVITPSNIPDVTYLIDIHSGAA